ncbi:MAG: ATP-grasp domain-containing protein [Thiobacillaceae bacterium]
MAQKLIHILGGGPWQVPTVRLAKALGYRVLVSDMYPDRPAYALADFHVVADITDREATLEIARRHRIDGILCDTTDVGVPTAAFVAEQLGLPGMGFATAINCTNKGRMRQLAERAGLVVPPYRLITSALELDEAAAAVGYPLVAKPVDNQSGRGVSRVADYNSLAAGFALAKRFSCSGDVLIEACVEGVEIIVDGFVVGGNPQILGLAYKTPYADNATVSSRINYPGGPRQSNHAHIRATARKALAALGLRDGVFHAEYILRGEDIVPIDVAARGGGCMIYTHVIPHVSGVDVNRAMIRMAMGESVRIDPLEMPKAANIEFMRMPAGKLSRIMGMEAAAAIPGVAAIHFNVGGGDHVGPLEHKDQRPGYVVALADTGEEAIDISHQAKSRISLLMAGNAEPIAVT